MNTNIIKIPRFLHQSKIFELGYIFFFYAHIYFFKDILFTFAHLLSTLSLQKNNLKKKKSTILTSRLACTNTYRSKNMIK